jgi:DNA-binding transcriptional LysR family regulator
MFDWNDLRYFLAVARTGSTIGAAKVLGVNQSTIQRRLAVLEECIGGKLVERHPTGYRLSELGEELLPAAKGVEDAVAAFERQRASCDKGLTGSIRVTCPEGLVNTLMIPLVDAFRARYSQVRIDLIVTERFLDLSRGEADVAVRGGEPRDENLIGRKIAESPWAVYASRSYIERHGRPERAEDLDQHAIIDFGKGITNLHLGKWLRSVAPHAKIVAHSETVIGLLTAVQSGAGLAILPTLLGDPEKDLVRVIDPLPELMSQIYLLTHPDLLKTPRVRAFVDFVYAEIDAYRPLLRGETQQSPSPEHNVRACSSAARRRRNLGA